MYPCMWPNQNHYNQSLLDLKKFYKKNKPFDEDLFKYFTTCITTFQCISVGLCKYWLNS